MTVREEAREMIYARADDFDDEKSGEHDPKVAKELKKLADEIHRKLQRTQRRNPR